ncbi:MAG: hypothetical protein NNA18_10100 [Nitrospira sp.]|nr:hypothetical protein [Nitrospira sp.]
MRTRPDSLFGFVPYHRVDNRPAGDEQGKKDAASSIRESPKPESSYRSFNASLLYCPECRMATPTRERLLLILPSGLLYEYRCARCGASTGSKTENPRGNVTILHP